MARLPILAIVSCAALSPSVLAQVTFTESEPNSIKTEATIVSGILPGDTITGVSTGGTVGAGLSIAASSDYFRIELPPSTPAVYCYSLNVTSSPVVDVTVRGLTQTSGVVNLGTDAAAQPDPAAGSPPPEDVWYGFGRAEKLYVRVTGSAATTGSYVLAYSCTPVTPAAAGALQEGLISVTTIGQGHTTNTEIQLFDSAFIPVTGGHNDDFLPGVTTQSRIDVVLTPGTYYLAIGDFNTSMDASDASVTEGNTNGNVLDFPDLIVNGSTSASVGTPVDVSFSISNGVTTLPVVAAKTGPYEIHWASFTVFPASPGTAYCLGDGTGTACPCANSGVIGNGCANSINVAGGSLVGTGNPSISGDTLLLSGSGIPNGPGLYFQGTVQLGGGNGIPFGDGLRCVGGGVIRLGIVIGVANASTYPSPNPPAVNGIPISVKGLNVAGNVRNYQLWYRDSAAGFCTASVFNLTPALNVTWTP